MSTEHAAASRLHAVALSGREGAFDVVLDGGRIDAILPLSQGTAPGGLLLPAFVNAHAHANRAFSVAGHRARSLEDAVAQARAERASLGVEDYRARARQLFDRAIAHGTARMRTHTDIDGTTGLRAIEGVLAAARESQSALDVELVAFAHAAADPVLDETQDLLARAVAMGAGLIGAVPALCASPAESIDALLRLADRLAVEVDLHLDEHLDPGRSQLAHVVDRVIELGLQGRVTVSHACALSAMSETEARQLLERMAEARISLVVLPELNLYLQGRDRSPPGGRGIAPMRLALEAGVAVRLGTDNVRDWFFPFGDGDLLESGYVAAIGAHVDTAEDLLPCLCGGRGALAVGESADLVLLPAASFDEALAMRPAGRVLIRGGRRV